MHLFILNYRDIDVCTSMSRKFGADQALKIGCLGVAWLNFSIGGANFIALVGGAIYYVVVKG